MTERNRDSSDLAAALAAQIRQERRQASPEEHPAPEELAAYQAGALPAAREEAVRVHLVDCEECAELLLELVDLESRPLEGTTREDEVSEVEVEAAWQRLRPRIGSAQPSGVARRTGWAGWVAAACLALVAAGLGFEVLRLRQQAGWLETSDLARVIAEPQGRRDLGQPPPVLILEPDKPGLVLLLLRTDLPFVSYRVEFFSEQDRPLLTREGLSAAEDLLLIPISPNRLPIGRIRVVVSGLRQDHHQPVEEYVFEVRAP